VNGRIRGILELPWHPCAITQPGKNLLSPRDGAFHSLRAFGEHELRAQRSQHISPFLRHGVGHGEDAAIPPSRRHVSESDPGVPAGRLDDDHARAQLSLFDGIVDHGGPDAVFHRIVWIVALVFHHDAPRQSRRHAIQAYEWRIAEGLGDILIDLSMRHDALSSWCSVDRALSQGVNNTSKKALRSARRQRFGRRPLRDPPVPELPTRHDH
jgi:hypothetical protein